MEKRELKPGDILQLKPEHKFGGMLVIVDEAKSFGCQGYLMSSKNFEAIKYKGRTFVRPTWDDMEYVGCLEWIEQDRVEEEDADI